MPRGARWHRACGPRSSTRRRFASFLYTAGQPDPDLLIRTSGEMRVSNYLLWQIAYAEIYVTDTLWPDFRRRHLLEAVLAYQKRERRYGGITAPRRSSAPSDAVRSPSVIAESACAQDMVRLASGDRHGRRGAGRHPLPAARRASRVAVRVAGRGRGLRVRGAWLDVRAVRGRCARRGAGCAVGVGVRGRAVLALRSCRWWSLAVASRPPCWAVAGRFRRASAAVFGDRVSRHAARDAGRLRGAARLAGDAAARGDGRRQRFAAVLHRAACSAAARWRRRSARRRPSKAPSAA